MIIPITRRNTGASLVVFLLCCVILLIPDSKATKFFQFSTGMGTISPDKVIVLLTIFIGVISIIVNKMKLQIKLPLVIMYMYAVWLFATGLSDLLYGGSFFELNMIVFKLIMNVMVFYVVYTFSVNDKRFIDSFINFFLKLSYVNAIFAILQFTLKSPLFMGKYFLIERGFYLSSGIRATRAWGFQGEPLALGTVSMVGVLLISWRLMQDKVDGKKTKLSNVIGWVLLFVSLMLSFSRGNIFATLICLLIFIITYKIKIFTIKRVCLSMITVPFVVWYVNHKGMFDVVWTRISRTDDRSYTHRLSVIGSVDDIMNTYGLRSLFGLSPGSSNGLRELVGVMDNNYINLLFEGGIIGFFLIIFLFLLCLKINGDSTTKILRIILFSLMLNMMTYELTYYSSTGVLFFTILGLISSRYRSRNVELLEITKKRNTSYFLNHLGRN
ncbi:hypothetical protein H8B09_18145 [Paenibacillus sp. PR3]|uniref:O-antigen ligase domain-containing protein n=1 Tax=Paenibacillus terricola TaxID=2763503 RepID=A0ABR8N021_9BACL|nr:hypothetical protein [Paenibacillus terricola]MBD3920692.1 hypothetical protein [Paenibacillus terricola]